MEDCIMGPALTPHTTCSFSSIIPTTQGFIIAHGWKCMYMT